MLGVNAVFFQNGEYNFCIQVIILGKQHAFFGKRLQGLLENLVFMLVSRKLFFGRKFKREADRSYCSGTEFAFHIDRSAHQIHEGFDDRKAEAGSGDVAFGGGMFSCKFFKNMRQILFAHADTVVLHGDAVGGKALPWCRCLFDFYGNFSALRRILDGVADDIQQNLPYFCPVAEDGIVFHRVVTEIGKIFAF